MITPLQQLAARFVLGRASAEEIRSAIDDVVRAGFCDDACIDALISQPAQIDEVLPALRSVLAHEGHALPARKQACLDLIEWQLRRIVEGEVPPLDGMDEVMGVYREIDEDAGSTFVGQSLGIEQLVGLYWSQEELRQWPERVSCNGRYGAAGLEELGDLVRVEAERWLDARRGRPPGSAVAPTIEGDC